MLSGRIARALGCAAIALAAVTSVWLARGAGPPAGPGGVAAAPAIARPAGVASPGRLVASGSRPATVARLTAAAAPFYRTPRQIAWHMLVHRFHWKHWQFKYLNLLWDAESGWNRYATNPYSGAYGIPQAVPGSKMASAGPRWRSSARTQIRWGMRYIQERYRTPYWAWENERHYSWY